MDIATNLPIRKKGLCSVLSWVWVRSQDSDSNSGSDNVAPAQSVGSQPQESSSHDSSEKADEAILGIY